MFKTVVFRDSGNIYHEWEESSIEDDDHIDRDEVIIASSSLKTGNICGLDQLCNEHLIHGGLMLKHYLTCFI